MRDYRVFITCNFAIAILRFAGIAIVTIHSI